MGGKGLGNCFHEYIRLIDEDKERLESLIKEKLNMKKLRTQ